MDSSGRYTENYLSWSARLEGLGVDRIKIGLDYCEELLKKGATGKGTTWPPTLPEFIGYCEPKKGPSTPPEHKEIKSVFQRLPEPKEHREARNKKGIEECERIMKFLED